MLCMYNWLYLILEYCIHFTGIGTTYLLLRKLFLHILSLVYLHEIKTIDSMGGHSYSTDIGKKLEVQESTPWGNREQWS